MLISWRPEDVVVFRPGMKNRLSGTIVRSTFMGNLTDVVVDVAGKETRAQMGSEVPYHEGDHIELAVLEDRIRILRRA